MKRYIVASTQRKKTTVKLLESLVNSDKVFYMSAAMEKSWLQEAMGRYYDPYMLNGDCYFKVARVSADPEEDEKYARVILHPYCIRDNEIVALENENDMSNDEYTYAEMPSTLTIMTEDEAVSKLNSIIQKNNKLATLNNYATDAEVEEIYNIVTSGKGFIAISSSNKRYLIVTDPNYNSTPQAVEIDKFELLRNLVPKTYKNSDILFDRSYCKYPIDNKCKKDTQGNITIRGTKLTFNMNNLEVVSKQEVASILNKIYDAVKYSKLGSSYRYYDKPYGDRYWNDN